MSFRDFRGSVFEQLQCHRYHRSSTAALSDVADRDSRSGPSANCLGIEADAFPIDLLEMSRLLLLLVAFDVEPTCQPAWLTAIIPLRSMLVEQLREVVVVLTE